MQESDPRGPNLPSPDPKDLYVELTEVITTTNHRFANANREASIRARRFSFEMSAADGNQLSHCTSSRGIIIII